jgi:hypothetical protein
MQANTPLYYFTLSLSFGDFGDFGDFLDVFLDGLDDLLTDGDADGTTSIVEPGTLRLNIEPILLNPDLVLFHAFFIVFTNEKPPRFSYFFFPDLLGLRVRRRRRLPPPLLLQPQSPPFALSSIMGDIMSIFNIYYTNIFLSKN